MKIFLILLFGVSLSACRTDTPPKISIICTLDGSGGGDCVEADGTPVHKEPSEMLNYWATTQTDEANFAGWCYDVPPATVQARMKKMLRKMLASRQNGTHEIAN